MFKEPEKSNQKIINKNQDLERNSVKKSTLSLSEIPNITKEEFNSDINPKKSISNLFFTQKALLYPNKLKKSFINDTIKNIEKDETPSSLAEIKKLLEIENKEKINKSISKKEKTGKKFSSKNIIEEQSKKYISQKQFISPRHNELEMNNNIEKEIKKEKEKYEMYKTRKSDVIKTTKKNKNILGITDSPKKKAKRKSIISQPNVSPSKIYTAGIFEKFFSKKISFEKKEKRNEDKIYINIKNKEELLITVNTTQETIKNYYEYMQECFQIIDLNFNKNIKLQEVEPINFQFKENKKIVVFELESTLVSYYIENLNLENGDNNTLGINIRPHLKQSLDLIKNDYNIVIYSSGSKNYVDAILDFIDPEHYYFNLRLYREHCNKFIINNKIYFTKNLNIFKRICPLKDIVMVDCSVIGFGFFLENGIPIIPYYDSKEDVELKLLSYYLLSISSNNDLRIALKRDIELNYYLQKAKEKNNENKNNIDNIKSPEPLEEEIKKEKIRESKTYKFSNYIHIYKRNSHSFEKENNKKGTIKKKRKGEKEEDNKYISPKKEKLSKKKSRKYTANTRQRNYINFKSPIRREKGQKTDSKKDYDKNK